jgi:hypothetical protein
MKNKFSFKSMAVVALLCILSVAANAQVPKYKCEIRNATLLSPSEYQFDIYLMRTGETPFEFAGMQMGINFNNAVIPEGAVITPTITGKYTVNACNSNKQINIAIMGVPDKAIRITIPVPTCGAGNGTMISNVAPGNLVCQVKLTSSKPFVRKTSFDLSWNFSNPIPIKTNVFYYPVGAKGGSDCTVPESHSVAK